MAAPGSIIVNDVQKKYHIVMKAAPRMGGFLLSKAFEYFRREEFEALRGVSLSIGRGEMVGLLGHNGAGKSTLLKVIAGITEPNSGTVEVGGRVTSLLELGVGFHPDLTGMENIFYSGVIMGMSRQQILHRLDAIIAFSGIADFLYEPVRHYSSGMYSRLACSVALHLEPEIVLVDEILSVGDAEFQHRALNKVRQLHAEGVTVLFVSHDIAMMMELCSRIVWLDHGRVREDGPPREVMTHYSKHMLDHAELGGPFAREFQRSGAPLIRSVELSPSVITSGDPVRVNVALDEPAQPIKAVIRWTRATGEVLSEHVSPAVPPRGKGAASLAYCIDKMPLAPVEGSVSVAIIDADTGAVLDQAHDVCPFRVVAQGRYYDYAVLPPVEWTIDQLAAVGE